VDKEEDRSNIDDHLFQRFSSFPFCCCCWCFFLSLGDVRAYQSKEVPSFFDTAHFFLSLLFSAASSSSSLLLRFLAADVYRTFETERLKFLALSRILKFYFLLGSLRFPTA
jgi:hypothetical protein